MCLVPGLGAKDPQGVGRGVPAAATHAGAGSGGGAERSRPGPLPCRRLGHPPGAVASRPGVYEPGPQAQQPPPARGGGNPNVKRRLGWLGEQDQRRRPFLTVPLPSAPSGGSSLVASRRPPGSSAGLREFLEPPPPPQPRGRRGRGGPGGPAAASALRKLYKNKIVTAPGQVALDGQKPQPEETQEEEKRR